MQPTQSAPIEPARLSDAEPVATLIRALAPRPADPTSGDDAARAAVDAFTASIDPAAIARLIHSPSVIALVARTRSRPVGFAALADGTHVLHLFVAPDWRRRGLGRQLWHALVEATAARGDLRAAHAGHTLDASPDAVAFCERLGFVACEPARHRPPLTFQPMRRPPHPDGP